MVLYPDIYIENIKSINLEMLKKNNIKGLILDIDNTLIDYDKNMLDGAIEWSNNLQAKGIKMCILSNTNKLNKVKNVADKLNLKFIYFSHKPSKKAFAKAKKLLDLKEENIGVVGDQIFTDVWGGNRSGMYTILTKPIDKRDIWITKIKRPLEKIVIRRYNKNRGNIS